MARQIFEMTTEDLQILMDACWPWSNAARMSAAGICAAWDRLGQKMGFDPLSVSPSGDGDRRFSAEPLPAQSKEVASTRTKVIQHTRTAVANLGDLDNCAQSRLAAAIALVESTKHGLSEIMHAAGCPDEMTGVEDFLTDMMGDHFHLLVKDAAKETAEDVEAFGSDYDELRDRDNPAALDARSQGVGRVA